MKKVLIVDDHPHIRRIIEVNLTKTGAKVLNAADGEEGLAVAAAEKPDLIILDVMMPKKNGFEVLRTLKASAELQAIPVIMLTVKAHSQDVAEGVREGAEYYMPKPFHPNELMSLIERILQE